jgi:hypothetical protein
MGFFEDYEIVSLKQPKVNTCLFDKVTKANKIFVRLYVDDLLIATSSTQDKGWVKTQLKNHFKMNKMGLLTHFLGISVY